MHMEIEHDPAGQKFYIRLGKEQAVLAYTEVNKFLDVHQVIVPEDYRNHGIAEELTLHAYKWAKENGYKIIPTCPYIKKKFLSNHPEFQEITAEDYFS